jgi:membrane-associated protease RseP (regulator of RpoE activity)
LASALTILAIYAAIWAVICVAWWAFRAERFGITGPPLYIVYRTARLNEWIRRISAWRPIVWRTIWDLGIVTGVGSMVFIFYKLASNLLNLSVGSQQAVSVQPILPVPGVGVSFETFPFLLLALSICLVSHELSHGIASLAERVPLKSAGAFFGHVFVGGFVEPDEDKLNEARNATKLRVFAAGSYTNLVLGVLCVLLLANFTATITPFYNIVPSGVQIASISANLPAHASGLQAGDTVTAINGTKISDINDLRQFMASVMPGQVVNLQTQRGSFLVKTAADPSNSSHALIGIGLSENINYVPKLSFLSSDLPTTLFRAEYWASVVLTSVALINMLPMYPFDGDKFLEAALNLLGVRDIKQIRTIANGGAYAILLLNVGLSLLRFGFVRF